MRATIGRVSAAVATFGLLATACSSGLTSDNTETAARAEADVQAESGDSTTTQRTIREENTTTTAEVVTTSTTSGPLPDPEWLDVEFVLKPIADTEQALAMATRPGGDDLWLVEREGRVRVVQRRVSLDDEEEALKLMNTIVLDIRDKVGTESEGGLLGIDFSTNGRLMYVSYTRPDRTSVIAEYQMDLLTAMEETERIVLEVPQPYPNHNGGQITFGPDGFLYFALGDGGSGGDPENSGQDTSTLLGSFLRIDPLEQSDDNPYRIPDDNPFVGRDGYRPEIWLYGVRNPWRFSFDAKTGDLWMGDVGQNELEEIDFLPVQNRTPAGRGANLGWRIMEGDQIFDGDEPPPDHVGPILTYGHQQGRCSVTGGYVYRGEQIPVLDGVYLYADYCSGEVFGLKRLEDGRTIQAPLAIDAEIDRIVSFGQGPENEIYIFEADGTVSRLQTGGWGRRVEVYASDEQIPGGSFEVEVTPGPDDPGVGEDGG